MTRVSIPATAGVHTLEETPVIDLKQMRNLAGMSQADVAEALGLRNGQRTVSQMEARDDWLVSKVAAYVQALGGTAKLTVMVNGEELQYRIA